jgi:hypothetical protein
MNSRLLMVGVFASFLLATSAYAQTYYLPQFADGNFGVVYKTSFILFNNSDVSVTATLKLTRDDGSPLTATIPGLGTGSQFTISLSAGATKIYQTDGTSSAVGAATVTATAPIGVSAVFTVSDAAGNFLSESGVGASDLMTDFMLPVDTTGSAQTGLALFNPGTSDASLTLTLFATDGTTPSGGTMPPLTLGQGKHMAAYVGNQAQFFPTVQNFRGTMRIQTNSSAPISAVVLRQTTTSTTTTFTSLPVVPRSSTKMTLNLPQIANGSFGNISFKTSFLIFNISQSVANVTLALTNDNGEPMTVTTDSGTSANFFITLAPNASVFLQTNGSGTGSAGAAAITSNVPVGASAIFTVLNSQGQFQTEAGVGDSATLTSMTLPVDITGLSDTGVAFFNPGASSATLTLKLLDATGAVSGSTTTRSLSAKGHLSGFVDQFFSVSNFRGSLAVSSTGAIASVVLRQYNGGANYTTLPTASGTATGTTPPPTSTGALLSRTLTGINPPSTQNVTLPAGFQLSGTVSGAGTASTIIANGGGTNIYAGAVNASTGRYVIIVPQGTYQLTAFYQPTGSNSTVTVTGSNLATVQVNADTTQNITLPSVSLFNVTGNVSGMNTLSSGTSPSIIFTATDNTMQGTFTIGAGGNFQGVLPSGSYIATIELASIQFSGGLLPQTEAPLALYNVGSLTVSGASTSKNYQVPTTATLSGTVNGVGLGQGTTSAFSATVTASDTSATTSAQLVCCAFPATSAATASFLTSQYQMILAQNQSYSIGVSATLMQGESTLLGILTFPVPSMSLNLSGSMTQDFTVPSVPSTSTISGRVTDSSSNGVVNVVITATTQSITGTSNAQFSAFTTTDSSGNYSLTVLNGSNYTVTYMPIPPTP